MTPCTVCHSIHDAAGYRNQTINVYRDNQRFWYRVTFTDGSQVRSEPRFETMQRALANARVEIDERMG